MKPLPVVLLAGGLGLRQRSDGDDLPKSLRPLPDNRALLLHVLDYYSAFGLHEFVICVGYRAEAIQALLVDVFGGPTARVTTGPGWTRVDADLVQLALVDSGEHADKCRRLLDARRHVGDRRFLLGYADVLSDLDLNGLIGVHEQGRGRVTMTVTQVRSRYGQVALGPGSRVAAFEEKPIERNLISAGYFVCEPTLFDDLRDASELEADVLPRLATDGQLHAHHHRGLWVTLDTYKDFMDVESLVHREGCAWLTPV